MGTLRRAGRTSTAAGARGGGLVVREVNSDGIHATLEKILVALERIEAQLNDITELES